MGRWRDAWLVCCGLFALGVFGVLFYILMAGAVNVLYFTRDWVVIVWFWLIVLFLVLLVLTNIFLAVLRVWRAGKCLLAKKSGSVLGIELVEENENGKKNKSNIRRKT